MDFGRGYRPRTRQGSLQSGYAKLSLDPAPDLRPLIPLVSARASDESRTSEPLDMAKQCSISSDVFFENEDDSEAVPGPREDGALVMESLEGLSDVSICENSVIRDHTTQHTGSGMDSQGSTGIGTLESLLGSPGRSTPEEGDGGLFSVGVSLGPSALLVPCLPAGHTGHASLWEPFGGLGVLPANPWPWVAWVSQRSPKTHISDANHRDIRTEPASNRQGRASLRSPLSLLHD